MATLTKEELRVAKNTLRVYLIEGKGDEQARIELGLSVTDFYSLKKRLFEEEVAKLQKTTPEEWFVDYIIKQGSNIQALTDMLDDWKESKQQSAMVGAVRARSDIYDKIIERGQSFGIIAKQPEEKRIIAGIAVANLTNAQLQKTILREIAQLNRLMGEFGEDDLLALEAGEIYSSPAEVIDMVADKPPKASKKNRAKTSRVHKGRRRVRAAGE